jgi:hypothetical protein
MADMSLLSSMEIEGEEMEKSAEQVEESFQWEANNAT